MKLAPKTSPPFGIYFTLPGGVGTNIAMNILHPQGPGPHLQVECTHTPCAFTPLGAIAVSTPPVRVDYIANGGDVFGANFILLKCYRGNGGYTITLSFMTSLNGVWDLGGYKWGMKESWDGE